MFLSCFSLLFICILAYFVSGFFRYHAVAVATGSMTPNINVGDVVIVDQYIDVNDLKVKNKGKNE